MVRTLHDWYILHVLTGKEADVAEAIKRNFTDIKALVPQRTLKEQKQGKWRFVTRTLFPGYVFIAVKVFDICMYHMLKAIPAVIRMLGGERPEKVSLDEMQVVLRLGGDGDPLGISDAFIQGGRVTIVSGPLVGLEGQIVKVDARRFRVKVNIFLMNEPRLVELGLNVIEKIQA